MSAPTRSRRSAWQPSYSHDLDPIAVDRIISGHPPARVTRAELRTAVATLTDQGLSTAQIARRTGLSNRTVTRYRVRARQAAAR